MTERLFNETINGVSLSQIHNAAFASLLRAYHSDGSVYMSWEDLDEIAWYATMAVYEKRDSYVKKDKNVCGLACTMAYNELMSRLNKGMRKNKLTAALEVVDTDRGSYNTADAETGKNYTHFGVGVDREFDTTFGEGMRIIEREVEKLSELDRKIYEMNLDHVPHKKIAEACHISYVNARKRWHDIRKKLLKNEYIFNRAYEMGLVG